MPDTYRSILQNKGYRMTPQRMAILQIMKQSGRHMTPIEVYQAAKNRLPGISEPTVYRVLSFLSSQGLLLAAHIGSGQLVYETADHDHHHLICRKCGQTYEISHNLIEPFYSYLNKLSGFQVDGMHVTFFGLCPECCKMSHKPESEIE